MKPNALLPLGALAVGLGWLWLRSRARGAELPASVEPDVGGYDEAPPGSADTAEPEQAMP